MRGIALAPAVLTACLFVSGTAADTAPPGGKGPAAGSADAGAGSPTDAPAKSPVYFAARDADWIPAAPSLPKGAKIMVLSGDPAAPGPFTMRVLLPAGYRLPPHWHPADENVTVISGTFHHGPGEVWDESRAHAMGPGSFISTPVGARHFAWTGGETLIQVHAVGPWGIQYVDPTDDPRPSKRAVE